MRTQAIKAKLSQRASGGFTLIELVVVISIIAILSAVALPRLSNIAADAHRNSVRATGGGFASAVSLARSTWVSGGQKGATVNLAGYGDGTIDVSVKGWPAGVSGNTNPAAITSQECLSLFVKLLQSNAPSVSLGTAADYQVTLVAGSCRYTYQRDTSGNYIQYDPSNGDVITIIH